MFRKRGIPAILGFIALGIKIFSLYPLAVEKYYSTGIYPFIASFQRILLGWIPFSVGDLLYAIIIVWLIYRVVALIRSIRNKNYGKAYYIGVIYRMITFVLLVYVVFNVLWGLNYNRAGIAYQLRLATFEYTSNDLVTVTGQLVQKLNTLQPASERSRKILKVKRQLFKKAFQSYSSLAKEKSFLKYSFPSVKPSVYSYLGNYLGFTGYYNPFTGEAQVNTTVPVFERPFTTCHEIGHQLGYAKESEANFAGYLAATASTDSAFLYSVYFDMYAYAARYLYFSDSAALKRFQQELAPGVKKDITEIRTFYIRYATPLETAIDRLYSEYLKANEQPSGKMSYNEVVSMLIAYYRKYGKI